MNSLAEQWMTRSLAGAATEVRWSNHKTMQTSLVGALVCDLVNLSLEVVANLMLLVCMLLRPSDASLKKLTVLLDAWSSSDMPAHHAPKVTSVLPCQLLAHLPGPPELLLPDACLAAPCGSSAHLHDRCIMSYIDEDALTSASQLAKSKSAAMSALTENYHPDLDLVTQHCRGQVFVDLGFLAQFPELPKPLWQRIGKVIAQKLQQHGISSSTCAGV